MNDNDAEDVDIDEDVDDQVEDDEDDQVEGDGDDDKKTQGKKHTQENMTRKNHHAK